MLEPLLEIPNILYVQIDTPFNGGRADFPYVPQFDKRPVIGFCVYHTDLCANLLDGTSNTALNTNVYVTMRDQEGENFISNIPLGFFGLWPEERYGQGVRKFERPRLIDITSSYIQVPIGDSQTTPQRVFSFFYL
jgi:hypothetical protein